MIMLMKTNYRNANKKIKLDDHIYTGKRLGLYAIKEINEAHLEFSKLMKRSLTSEASRKIVYEKLETCTCLQQNQKLPCIHDIYKSSKSNQSTLFTEENIPKIYFIQELIPLQDVTEPSIVNMNSEAMNYNYNSLFEQISPWISAAPHDPRIMNEFKLFLEKMENYKVIIDPDAGKTLASPGAPLRFPSSLVDHKKPGKPKTKRIIRCSNCGNPGHNRTACTLPPKSEDDIFLEQAKKKSIKQNLRITK